MTDIHEKTQGGFGPTRKEWEEEIFPELEEQALQEGLSFVKSADAVGARAKDADTVYSYTGKQHRATRFALRTLCTMLCNKIYIDAKSHEYRAQRLEALEQRVEALDGIAVAKTLDVEAYDSLAEMAERLEKLEAGLQEVADNGFRYRGYWRDGMKAKRGDAFTHDGSMWWAIRDTSEKPCKESFFWQVAVRKGRDAK